jgi:hypothetical protein
VFSLPKENHLLLKSKPGPESNCVTIPGPNLKVSPGNGLGVVIEVAIVPEDSFCEKQSALNSNANINVIFFII